MSGYIKETSQIHRRRWMMSFMALGLSLVLGILLGEGLLRVFGFTYPVRTQGDKYTGYAYIPRHTWVNTKEGYSVVEINQYGFRDQNWAITKPAETYRIAVVGDSFVAAEEVAEADRFTTRLRQQLHEIGVFSDQAVEIMNFGQSGFGTAQQLQVLRHKVLPFKPDLVLLAVYTGNDIINNASELDDDPIKPYFKVVNGGLQLDPVFREYRRGTAITLTKLLAPYSRLMQLAYRTVHAIETYRKQAKPVDKRTAQLRSEFGFNDPDTGMPIYSPPQNESWENAWKLTEALILQFKQEATAAAADFRLVTLSNDVQVFPAAATRGRLQKLVGSKDLFYPDRRIKAFCKQHGIRSLHLAEPLQKYAAETGDFLHGFSNSRMGFGHWNEVGHREAANRIGQWLGATR